MSSCFKPVNFKDCWWSTCSDVQRTDLTSRQCDKSSCRANCSWENAAVASIRPAISAWGTMDGSSDFFYKECICNAQGRYLQGKCSISKCHLVSVISWKIWLQRWLLSDLQLFFQSTRNRGWIKMAVYQLSPVIFRKQIKQLEWNKFLLFGKWIVKHEKRWHFP